MRFPAALSRVQPSPGAGAQSRMRSAPAPWRCRSASTATRSPALRRRPARHEAAPGAPAMCPTLPGASSLRTAPTATPAAGTSRRRTRAGGECLWLLGPHGHRCCPRVLAGKFPGCSDTCVTRRVRDTLPWAHAIELGLVLPLHSR